MQLVFPLVIKRSILPIIITVQVIISFEYVWNFVVVHIPTTETHDDHAISSHNKRTETLNNILSFFTQTLSDGKIKIEYILLPILYCFYFEFQIYSSDLYKKYDTKQYSFNVYLAQKMQNYPRCQVMLETMEFFFKGCYIWMLLGLLFMSIFLIDINVLFCLKLTILLLIVYKFVFLVKNSNITFICWIFVIYCWCNTMICYFYQFINLKLVKPYVDQGIGLLPDIVKHNLDLLGLKIYPNTELPLQFLPHYGSNFLSVLLLYEVRRILNQTTKYNLTDPEVYETFKVDKVDLIGKKAPYWKLYSYYIILFLTKSYWLMILGFVLVVSVQYQLSISMLLYMVIFLLNCLRLSRAYLKDIKEVKNKKLKKGRPMFFLIKMLRYKLTEKRIHWRLMTTYKLATFKWFTILASLFIVFTYLYALVGTSRLLQGDDWKSVSVMQIVVSVAYLTGSFHTERRHIIVSVLYHLLLICLISIDSYISSLQEYLQNEIENINTTISWIHKLEMETEVDRILHQGTEDRDENTRDNRSQFSYCNDDPKHQNLKLNLNVNCQDDHNNNVKYDRSCSMTSLPVMVESYREMRETREVRNGTIELGIPVRTSNFLTKSYSNQVSSSNISLQAEENGEDRSFLLDPLVQRLLNVFKKTGLMSKKLKRNNIKLDYYCGCKNILEEVIVLAMFICAIKKLNIFSLFYLVMILVLQIKGKSSNSIFVAVSVCCFFVILQYTAFILNFNYSTDTDPEIYVLDVVKHSLRIPLYTEDKFLFASKNWTFYFSFGVEKYQTTNLLSDYVVILLCLLHLEQFTYLIFQKEDPDSDYSVLINRLKNKKALSPIFAKISCRDYSEIRSSLIYNFSFCLPTYDVFKQMSRKDTLHVLDNKSKIRQTFHSQITEQVASNKKLLRYLQKYNKKSMIVKCLIYLKHCLYLSLHNICIICIMVLSMVNDSLISVIYLIFCFYYLYHCRKLLLAKKCTFPVKVKSVLVNLIYIDILIQILYQTPWSYLVNDHKILQDVFHHAGIRKIVSSYLPLQITGLSLSLLEFKAVTYFMASLQVLVYSSQDFKYFLVAYLFQRKDRTVVYSAMNSCLFNNQRMHTMQKAMDYRCGIKLALDKLEKQLKNWDDNLNKDMFKSRRLGEIEMNDLHDKTVNEEIRTINELTEIKEVNLVIVEAEPKQSKEELVKQKIKQLVMDRWLIKAALFFNKISTSYIFVTREYKQQYDSAVLKGQVHIPCIIERKIEKFLNKLNLEELLAEEVELLKEQGEEDTEELLDDRLIVRPKEESLLHINQQHLNSIFQHKIFCKYLSHKYLFNFIVFKIVQCCYVNFHFLTYSVMILCHFANANLLSVFFPVSVFGYAILEYPKPKKFFWNVVLVYTTVIIAFKFLSQLDIVTYFFKLEHKSYIIYKDPYYIGVKIFAYTCSAEYFSYVFYDCLVILFTLFQQYALIRSGVKRRNETDIETVEEAYDRFFKANSCDPYNLQIEYEKLVSRSQLVNQSKPAKRASVPSSKASADTFAKQCAKPIFNDEKYFDRLFPKLRVSTCVIILYCRTRNQEKTSMLFIQEFNW